jgi:hypothetical protein
MTPACVNQQLRLTDVVRSRDPIERHFGDTSRIVPRHHVFLLARLFSATGLAVPKQSCGNNVTVPEFFEFAILRVRFLPMLGQSGQRAVAMNAAVGNE